VPVKTLFKSRGWLVLPPVFAAFFCFRWETGHDTVIWAIGGPVFLAAVGLRVWAQCHLHYRLHVHKVMTTEGPYRYTRNPIYVANTAIVASLVLLMECAWLVLPAVVWCAVAYSAGALRGKTPVGELWQSLSPLHGNRAPVVRGPLRARSTMRGCL